MNARPHGAPILTMMGLMLVPVPSRAATDIYGLVVGYNLAPGSELEPLHYADDDAVKNAQLIQDYGGDTVLLTELDADSARVFEGVRTATPTREALTKALGQLNERIDASKSAGRSSHLFLFYSGHGDVKNNEGFVYLADGELRRSDLLELITASRADVNHLIIDACKSYFLIYDRGPGGQRERVHRSYVHDARKLPDNVGMLLSTSAAQDSHEWEAYQGGVFGHQVRSALRGAADVDDDGAISYDETAAFIYAANNSIPNPRYRPRFFARGPRGENAQALAIMQMSRARHASLLLDHGPLGHVFLEDDRGARLADLHPGAANLVRLSLPERRPLFLRVAKGPVEYVIPEATGEIRLSKVTPRAPQSRSRGAEHVAFGLLFADPFDATDMAGYAASLEVPRYVVFEEPFGTTLRPALGWTALVTGASGLVLAGLARFSEQPDVQYSQDPRIDRYEKGAVGLLSVSALSLAIYLTWTFWPDDPLPMELSPDEPAALHFRF